MVLVDHGLQSQRFDDIDARPRGVAWLDGKPGSTALADGVRPRAAGPPPSVWQRFLDERRRMVRGRSGLVSVSGTLSHRREADRSWRGGRR